MCTVGSNWKVIEHKGLLPVELPWIAHQSHHSVLGPVLLIIYVNGINVGLHKFIAKFTDVT